jgi:hypothetical protein
LARSILNWRSPKRVASDYLSRTFELLTAARFDALGDRLDGVTAEVRALSRVVEAGQAALRETAAEAADDLEATLATLELGDRPMDRVVREEFDGIPQLRRALLAVREGEAFREVWHERHPLVTIPIATWNRADLLVDRAVASILRQTYQHFEIVIVGDHCTDDTEQRLRALHDPRITFLNLQQRAVYPSDPLLLWMAAGAETYNAAVERARGTWIAPIDDDDEFTDDHIEVLLEHALAARSEVVYGKVTAERNGTESVLIGTYPPRITQINMSGMMYLRLLDFIKLDPRCWILGEPSDWNVIRRWMRCGVTFGFVDRPVARIYPTGPRDS